MGRTASIGSITPGKAADLCPVTRHIIRYRPQVGRCGIEGLIQSVTELVGLR
jgi:hypothetical protein